MYADKPMQGHGLMQAIALVVLLNGRTKLPNLDRFQKWREQQAKCLQLETLFGTKKTCSTPPSRLQLEVPSCH